MFLPEVCDGREEWEDCVGQSLTYRTQELPGCHVEIIHSVESEAVNSVSFFGLETLEELLIAGGVHCVATAGDVVAADHGLAGARYAGNYSQLHHFHLDLGHVQMFTVWADSGSGT